jgi:DNA-binding transcriptional ArsR family regulator
MKRKKTAKTTANKKSSRKTSPRSKAAAQRKPAARHKSPRSLPPLTGMARDLYLQVLNKIAFEDYGECCLIENLAERFGKTPGRLQPAIRKLVEQGYVTVEGETYPVIYPTIAALRKQDQRLSEEDARKLLAKVKRA